MYLTKSNHKLFYNVTDALNNDENDKKDEDEDAFYETESNEDLVKMRHQRELFLQKVNDYFAIIYLFTYL